MDSVAIAIGVGVVVLVLAALALSARVVQPYERMVIFRLGRSGPDLVREPGLRFVIPVIDRPLMVDIREKLIEVNEAATTRDNARIVIDGRVFWQIVDRLRSTLNVHSFADAVQDIATTALREVIGETLPDDVLSQRARIAEDVRAKLDEQSKGWGGKITTVEIRDIAPGKLRP